MLRLADEARSIGPHVRRMAFKAMKIDEAHARKSEQFVRVYLSDRDTWFASGRRYLVGERFTLADLTLAATLSPLALPAEHPFYPSMDLGAASEALIESFRGYRLLDWLRRCYAEQRARSLRRAPS